MADRFENPDKFARQELFLAELIRKSIQGSFNERDENVAFLHRALVVAVDTEGGKLENPEGGGKLTNVIDGKEVSVPAKIGPKNPANSVKARILTDGFDQFVGDDGLRVLWPFFPEHISLPIKPGEHVYVVFEDTNYEHGLWVTKIPGHSNVNFFKGSDAYKSQDPSLSDKFDDTRGASSPDDITSEKAAAEIEGNDGRLTAAFSG
jgi:hypothetical protein